MEETKKQKTAKQLERYFKGAANHRRIEILLLIDKNNGIAVEGIVQILNANFKTVSEHIRRLVQAGLVNKNYQGRRVSQTLSPYGKRFVEFIRTFQHS
jgi:Bacterial regulatory protein, arsR family.